MRGVFWGFLSAVLLFSVMGPVAAQEYRWDLPNEYAATSMPGEADALFAKIIKERSGGRIVVTVHPGGALGFKSEGHFDMVADGAIPLANTPPHHVAGYEPVLGIGSLPFLAKTPEEAKTLYEVSKPYYDKALRKHNQVLIAAVPWPPSGFWANRPITKVADIKGWKLRVYDVNGQLTLKEAGAAPIQLSWADIIPALSAGSISGVLTSAEGGVTSNFWDHQSHFNEINYAVPLSMIHMNLDVWNSLPPDLQEAVTETGEIVTADSFAKLATRRANNYKKMRAKGMTVVTEVEPELIALLQKGGEVPMNRWLGKMGADGQALLDEFFKRIGRTN